MGFESSYFGVNLTLSNNLPIGSAVFFGITSSCVFGLQFNGETNYPPCFIDNGSGYVSCKVSLRTGGLIVELETAVVASNAITIKIYGLSCNTTVHTHTCPLEITSYLSRAMSSLQKVDKSSTNLDIEFATALGTGSGSIAITNKVADQYQANAKSIVDIQVGITDRSYLYMTDHIEINLGSAAYDSSYAGKVYCSSLEKDTGYILTDFLTCNSDNTGFMSLKIADQVTSNLDLSTSGVYDDFVIQ